MRRGQVACPFTCLLFYYVLFTCIQEFVQDIIIYIFLGEIIDLDLGYNYFICKGFDIVTPHVV